MRAQGRGEVREKKRERPQTLYIDKVVVDTPVVMQRQVPRYSDCIEDSGNADQPGDQVCRVPTDSVHRQGCCRYACGDAVKGPSNSDGVEDCGSPAGAVRRQSCGGADGMRQVACTKMRLPHHVRRGRRVRRMWRVQPHPRMCRMRLVCVHKMYGGCTGGLASTGSSTSTWARPPLVMTLFR